MKQTIKRLNIGNIVREDKDFYTIIQSGVFEKSGLAMGYVSDKHGKPLPESGCWFRAFHDFTYKDLKRVGNIALSVVSITINNEEVRIVETSNKMFNTKLSLYDGRWKVFNKYASKVQRKKFEAMEAVNDHYKSAEFVNDFVKNLKQYCPELKIKRSIIK